MTVRRLLLLVCLAVSVTVLPGCGQAFWNGFAQGYAQSQTSGHSSASGSEQKVSVCAKYMTEVGWSNGYSVTANLISGAELNRRTGTFNYEAYSTYAAIFWAQNEVSVIKLENYYGSIGYSPIEGIDQQGRRWALTSGGYCY